MDSKATWPTAPNPGGIPDPIQQIDTLVEVVRDAIWISLGRPNPSRIYMSIQGDWWDLIAIKVYGRKRTNEYLMYRLIEENYALRDVVQFPAGIPVFIPETDIVTDIPLVPWKKATIIP